MSKLVERLAEELERPREVTHRVSDHVWSHYEIDRDAVGDFLETGLADLEDYEHDLILSPMFTPTLEDQTLFAELLGPESVPRSDWPALVQQLEDRPIRAQIVTADGEPHTVTLRDVSIERYVHRLRLEGAIPDQVWDLLQKDPFAENGPTFKAIARRAIWESDARRTILVTYLAAIREQDLDHRADGIEFLRVAEDYKPRSLDHLKKLILERQESIRQEIQASDDPKPFFNDKIQADHGFDRDNRGRDEDRTEKKQRELAFFDRLQLTLTR